jgi:hypothetical protein
VAVPRTRGHPAFRAAGAAVSRAARALVLLARAARPVRV